jgi:galactokinase
MASSLADTRHALFLDTRAMVYEKCPIPAAVELVVIDSGVPHRHAVGEYKKRREECARACAILGVRALRDLGADDLARTARTLPEPLPRRVRHVVTENARVLAAVAALRAGDAGALGTLFDASHASMRDDYEVSVPAVDRLVEIARREPYVFGARLTGGGFGGAVVILARQGAGRAVAARVADEYGRRSGLVASVVVPA